MIHTRKLVILGSTHHNTYSMVRCFGESGIKPDVIIYGNPNSFILLSVYINESHVASDAISALDILQEYYSQAVIIACSDEIASLMDMQFDRFSSNYIFFNCGTAGKLTHYMDKVVQSSVAAEAGFLVPNQIEGTPNEIKAKVLSYPCIIKPLESIHGGKNIQICNQKSALPAALSSFNAKEKVLVQEYIKKDYEIVVVGLSYEDNVVIPAYIHKHRDTKGGTTYSTVKPVNDLPLRVISSCKKIVGIISYKGLFGIEIIRRGNDYYFVEINLRNDATTYAISVAGCNLPLSYYRICNGEIADDILFAPVHSINAMVEFNDFIHVLKRRVSLRDWNRDRKKAECRYYYSKADGRAYKSQICFFMKFVFRLALNHLLGGNVKVL